jgi:hypothetical protein
MRAVEIAVFLICFQVGMGIVTESGLFTGTYYESEFANPSNFSNPQTLSETEQTQTSFDIMNSLNNILLWGWVTQYFEPIYSLDAGVRNIVDGLVIFLNGISVTIIGIAFIEFVRNQTKVFGG